MRKAATHPKQEDWILSSEFCSVQAFNDWLKNQQQQRGYSALLE